VDALSLSLSLSARPRSSSISSIEHLIRERVERLEPHARDCVQRVFDEVRSASSDESLTLT